MLITDKKELLKFKEENRIWQGIPGIEVTKKGRKFLTFYSGGTTEEIGNFSLLYKADDGLSFDSLEAVAYKADSRCFDPCLWIDPLDRLWFIWSASPEFAVYASICEDPDADKLEFSAPKKIGAEIMLNKPTVLGTGEWLFPIAVWKNNMSPTKTDSEETDRRAFVYKTTDNGNSFVKLGGTDMPKRSFDEHMILELKDKTLAMYVRTTYGIGISYSYDRGKTWTEGTNSGLGGPCSRFFIGRLKSGRILLVNHYDYKGRNNLTAMLSEDDGKTFPYKLLLDERDNVSYPDATEGKDGNIYITYDRERGAFLKSFEDLYTKAREILVAVITEEDIIAGELINSESKLKQVVSKLGKCALEKENPYKEIRKLSDEQLFSLCMTKENSEVAELILEHFGLNCVNMHSLDSKKLDILFDNLYDNKGTREDNIGEIISLLRNGGTSKEDAPLKEEVPVVNRIKEILGDNLSDDLSIGCLAEIIGISRYYMCHVFKIETGITIIDYRNELRITKAKEMLILTDVSITEIAGLCGFKNSSYFTEVFSKAENITPTKYRKQLKI